ncbi:probable threonine protease PRSS50 [Otolemur garnettii]|uniref:Probable threonine protease PRSS50 n=1 Tax=Otolemur garnettii TaxID=30611 RepID=H0XGC3_OTOGA|nr:probable threonine protease PRSS50 [Otolemur garnettii]
MEPWCGTQACGQNPGTSAATHACTLLLLLVLQADCLGSEQALGTLSTADPGVPCASEANCPSDPLHLPQEEAMTTVQTQLPVSEPDSYHTCGFSHEQDLTLRDPEAMARRWPWMVSVRANGTHVCAGTLIASRWVLTVAHCLNQRDVFYSVRIGSPWIDQTTQTTSDVPVLQVIVNSKYKAQRYWSWIGRANNIGLLKLKQVLQYNKYIWPICLPGLDFILQEHTLCTVTGWGLPKVDGIWPQFRTIQEKEVNILNSKDCDDFYHRFSKIPVMIRIINSRMICAEDVNREHFCYEVSGEPLVCSMEGTWYLVGVVSWGAGCKENKAPPVYTYIPSYQHWIWELLNGQPLAMMAPSRALLIVLPLPLSLLAAL